MVGTILRASRKLDQWLQARLGRPYSTLLSVGLMIEVVRRLAEIPERAESMSRIVPLLLFLALNVALLIHQLGELSERVGSPRSER
jgi:hypothetical protein